MMHTGYVIDTHTAVAAAVYILSTRQIQMMTAKTVIASTASPYQVHKKRNGTL